MVSYSPKILEDLRARLTLSELVGARVKLTRRGREFMGLCPFHNEKTPSFTVNDDKEFYHCFGCGAHGDAFKFLVDIENYTFPEAIIELASRVGFVLPEDDYARPVAPRIDSSLYDVMDDARMWFFEQLQSADAGSVRQYLRGRGLDGELVKTFGVGYAPQGRISLAAFLRGKGYDAHVLETVGLTIQPEGGRSPYDRFRERLMFPIRDVKGRTIAFGGRILGDGQPKYLNSPETPLFSKGHILYGHDIARKTLKKGEPLLVAEGYMDVIALSKGGFKAVAPLGTALTEDQIRLLWRMSPEPILCFDGDKAGKRAAFRAAERVLPLLKPGYSLRFAFMPQGEDPDSLIQAGKKTLMQQYVKDAAPLLDVLWLYLLEEPTKTPEQQAMLQKRYQGMLGKIDDTSIRNLYQNAWRQRFFETFMRKGPIRQKITRKAPSNISDIQQRILLAIVLNHPHFIDEVGEDLMMINFTREDLRGLCTDILLCVAEEPELSSEKLYESLLTKEYGTLLNEILSQDIYLHAQFSKPSALMEQVREGWCDIYGRLQEAKNLQDDCLSARDLLADEMSQASWERLKLLKELQNNSP